MPTARRRSIAAVVLLVTLTATGTATPTIRAQGAADRHAEVLVAVLGKNDEPVLGLTDKDFVVREDNTRREILNVKPGMGPTHVVLLVDDSAANAGETSFLRDGAKAFLTTVAAHTPAPQVRLTTFGDRPTLRQDFTSALPVLTRAADRLVPQSGAGSRLLEAISETCRDLRTRRIAGAAIVVMLNDAAQEFSDESHSRIDEELQSAGVSLWTAVQHGGAPRTLTDQGQERALVIGDSTRASGGLEKNVLGVQGLVPALRALGTALMSQYAITYGQADRLIPATRLTVETTDRSAKVLVRRWVTR